MKDFKLVRALLEELKELPKDINEEWSEYKQGNISEDEFHYRESLILLGTQLREQLDEL